MARQVTIVGMYCFILMLASSCREVWGVLFLQKFVNLLKIVKGIVDEEAEIRDYSHLTLYLVAKFKAYLALLGIDVVENLLTAL